MSQKEVYQEDVLKADDFIMHLSHGCDFFN